MATEGRIAAVDDVPDETTYLCTVREVESGEEREVILVRADDGVHAWLNYCQHYTHINIDKGPGAEMRNGELICENHGAYFESDTGFCTFGPCEGAYLNGIDIEVNDDGIYLDDDGYEFLRAGPMETDDTDLGSKSNYKF